jgi:putative ABC transport system permease protein
MSGEPGGFFDQFGFEVEGQHTTWNARTEFADFEFVKTLGIKIIAGRNFSSQFATDTTNAVLINHTAATKLGWTPQQAIGKWIKNTVRDDARRRIIGVVEDFNFLSLKENMDALVIAPNEDRRVALVKLKPGNPQSSLATIKNVYDKVAPQYPFEYSFLDQKFNELYRKDLRQQNHFNCICWHGNFHSMPWVVWPCIIYGYKTFQRNRRKKSIGFFRSKHCCVVIKRFVETCNNCCGHCITGWLLCNE